MIYSKLFKFFIKELSTSKVQIIKVFFTIFISLLIFSSVLIFRNNIENEISNNSRVLLGGDFELSSKNKPLNPEFLDELKKSYLLTKIFEFTSILRSENGESKTIRIKVIDNYYPLIGKVKVEPANSLNTLRKRTNVILVDKNIKGNLNLKIGDRVKIQSTFFEVIGFIKALPEIGGLFLFGDQAVISHESLKNLKVNNLGSFINYKYKIIEKENVKGLSENLSQKKNITIKSPEDTSQNLKKIIENFIYFLSIISASAILISGIGLKNSLFSYLSSNQFKIALFKSLGMSSNNIKMLYYLQTLLILVLCSLLAYFIGFLIISFFDYSLLSFLNIKFQVNFKIQEYLIIQLFSFFIFFIFAKPVIDSIEQIKVSDLFRNSKTNFNLKYKKKNLFEIFSYLLIFIFLFCILNVKPLQTATFFLFFIVIGIFYYFLSKVYLLILNKVKNTKSISVKIAIKNLNSYRNLNSIIVMTMGLGMTILFFLGIISSCINKELNNSIPKNAPNYFFLGIQKGELNLFSEQVQLIDKESKQINMPMISARILTINGKNPKEVINENNKSFWFINGERRISWSKKPPSNNPVSKGKWWDKDSKDKLYISLDSKVAKNLKLEIGDSITFNIYGNSITGQIKNFRKVDYTDFNMNFAILFNPDYASKIPHEFISTVKFNNEELVSLRNLLKMLPNITYIKLSEYINKTKNLLSKLFFVSIIISSTVILIGLVVISNAVNVIGNLKIYQNLVLKILGFEKSNLIKIIMFESLLISIPIIISSLIFSIIFSFIFITNFFGINYNFSSIIIFSISSVFIFVLMGTLFISNNKYMNLNTYFLIRNN